MKIEQEAKPTDSGVPPAYWPASGDLRVESLSSHYSPERPVLAPSVRRRSHMYSRMDPKSFMVYHFISSPANVSGLSVALAAERHARLSYESVFHYLIL
jgi:hypothetical protein